MPGTATTARHLLLVGLGGAIGAVARVGLATWRPADVTELPWITLAENLSGTLALAVLLTVLGRRLTADPTVRLLVGTGVLGSFTTYSTHSVELVLRVEAGAVGLAAAYLGLTLAGGLLTAAAGIGLGRWLTPLSDEGQRRGQRPGWSPRPRASASSDELPEGPS